MAMFPSSLEPLGNLKSESEGHQTFCEFKFMRIQDPHQTNVVVVTYSKCQMNITCICHELQCCEH